jgi:hypothetical protein
MANMRREQARTGFDQPDWSAVMSKYAMLGAALLAAAFVTPASAQAVVEDPGYCARFYPNANCQNYGSGQSHVSRVLSEQLCRNLRVRRRGDAGSASPPSSSLRRACELAYPVPSNLGT